MSLRLPCLALAFVLGVTAPLFADPRLEATCRQLADGGLSAREAAALWSEAQVSPTDAQAMLASLPRLAGETGDHEVTLRDSAGRESRLLVSFPGATRADGSYGLMIMLHGLRAPPEQFVRLGRRLAPPGTIVACPSAEKVSDEREGEDVPGIGIASRALPHWWCYRPDAFPLLALDHLTRRYPIDRDRVVLVGYSMGGYGTWNIGLRYPDRFAGLAPIAGGISRMENLFPRDDASRRLLANAAGVPSFFIHGDNDRTVPVRFSRTIAADLERLGGAADFTYEEVAGGRHILTSFIRGDALTAKLTEWLGARVRDPNPRRVTHTVIGDYHGASYWLRVDRYARAPASATAEVVAPNTIALDLDGVTAVTVFLDPDLVDLSQPVTVRIGETVVHQGLVAPSLEAVAESYAADRDPALTYRHLLRFERAR